MDQDSLGVQGFKYTDNESGLEVWVKPLSHGDWAVCFLNRGAKGDKKVDIDWSRYNISDDISKTSMNPNEAVYAIRDLWKKKDFGTTQKKLTAEVSSLDVLMLRLTKQ